MKRGMTISLVAITILVMFIIISVATAMGTSSIKSAINEEFRGKLSRVKDNVDMYLMTNKVLPTTGVVVSKTGLDVNLIASISENGDDQNNLNVIDMTKLNVEGVNLGYGTIQNRDIFLITENTNNIYYYKGMKYKGEQYYTI